MRDEHGRRAVQSIVPSQQRKQGRHPHQRSTQVDSDQDGGEAQRGILVHHFDVQAAHAGAHQQPVQMVRDEKRAALTPHARPAQVRVDMIHGRDEAHGAQQEHKGAKHGEQAADVGAGEGDVVPRGGGVVVLDEQGGDGALGVDDVRGEALQGAALRGARLARGGGADGEGDLGLEEGALLVQDVVQGGAQAVAQRDDVLLLDRADDGAEVAVRQVHGREARQQGEHGGADDEDAAHGGLDGEGGEHARDGGGARRGRAGRGERGADAPEDVEEEQLAEEGRAQGLARTPAAVDEDVVHLRRRQDEDQRGDQGVHVEEPVHAARGRVHDAQRVEQDEQDQRDGEREGELEEQLHGGAARRWRGELETRGRQEEGFFEQGCGDAESGGGAERTGCGRFRARGSAYRRWSRSGRR